MRKIILLAATSLLLAACGSIGGSPTALPTVVLANGPQVTSTPGLGQGGTVTASGIIVPAREATLSFAVPGAIESVAVSEGEKVDAGQVLARLSGSQEMQAAVSAADVQVLSAQQAVDDLKNDANWKLELAQAQANLASAQDELHTATYTRSVRQQGNRASQLTIDGAEAKLVLAKDRLDAAKAAYDHFSGRDPEDPQRAAALANWVNAQNDYNSALRTVNWYKGQPTAIEQAQLDSAVEVAQAKVDQAQQQVDRLKNGPDPDQLAKLEAELKSAQDQAAAARANLAQLELRAPFVGSVGKISLQEGEWATPGAAVLTVADLDHMQVQTTDLSERDVPSVRVGQAATVQIKALSQDVTGSVAEISPLADTLGGDVVYQVKIDLDSLPANARAGMTVDVQIQLGS